MDSIYLYDSQESETVKQLIEHDYFVKQELYSITTQNGVILPINSINIYDEKIEFSGVIDANGNYLNESSESGIYDELKINNKIDIESLSIISYDFDVVYIGVFHTSHWGQFFAMDINRLWYIIKNFKELKKIKIAYCGSPTFIENTFGFSSVKAYELLNILGIEKEQLIDVRSPSRFNTIIVPQKSFMLWQYYTKEYRLIFDTIANNVNLNSPVYNKIYFTRRNLPRNKEVGEKEFEFFFKKNGFVVVAPEQLSFKEQVWLMKNCEELASIEGTLAYNSLFSKKKIKQIVLRKQSEALPTAQFLKVKNINYQLIDVYKEPIKGFPISHDRGPFLLSFNFKIKNYALNNNMSFQTNKFYFVKKLNLIVYVYKCVLFGLIHYMKRFGFLKTIWRKYQLKKI